MFALDGAVDSNELARYDAVVTNRKMSEASLSARVGPVSACAMASSTASLFCIDVAAPPSAVPLVGESCSDGSSSMPATLMMLPSLRDKIKVDSTPGRFVNACRVFATCSDNDNDCGKLSQQNDLLYMKIASICSQG